MSQALVYRSRALEVADVKTRAEGDGGKAEFLELSFPFASEEPIEAAFGTEILEVTTRAARLDRVRQGVVPLLSTDEFTPGRHTNTKIVGRVLEVTIGSDRIARARVRFSRSAGAADVVQDVVDQIRQAVSFGYRIHKLELVESGDDGDVFRVVDWELYEITILGVPADPTVGLHRAAGGEEDSRMAELVERARRGRSTVTVSHNELSNMNDEDFEQATRAWSSDKRLHAEEEVRKIRLGRVARNFKPPEEMLQRALESGSTVDDFVQQIRDHRERSYAAAGQGPLNPPPTSLGFDRSLGTRDPVFGLDQHDVRGFSLFRAIGALASGRPSEAPQEFELSDYVRSKDPGRNYQSRGLSVPHHVMAELASRAVGKVAPNASGAALVGLEHLSSAFVEFLSPLLAVRLAGAQILNASGADLSIPRQITGSATTWIGENAGSGESSPGFDPILMSPKTVRARADMTRRMLLQSDPQVEALVTNEIGRAIAQAIDAAALAGPGGVAPEGILSQTGVGSVPYVTTSGTAERAVFLSLQNEVAASDAPMQSPALIMSSSMRSRLMGIPIDPGSGLFIARETDDPRVVSVAGIPAWVSNNTPRDLGVGSDEHAVFFGDWSELLLAMWSTVDIQPDLVTLGDSGGLVIRAFQDVDVALRHATSFAVTQTNPAA